MLFTAEQQSILWLLFPSCIIFLFSLELIITLFSCLLSFSMHLSIIQPCFSTYLNFFLIYRHTLFYCTLQILCFLTNWRSVATLHWANLLAPFSSNICSLHVSVSHFGNLAIFHTFSLLYLLWWSVISDLWCYYCKKLLLLKVQMMVSIF